MQTWDSVLREMCVSITEFTGRRFPVATMATSGLRRAGFAFGARLMAGCGLLVVLAAPTARAQLCTPPPPDMVAWYTGDDCTPSDLLGQHHGAFIGDPVCTEAGKVGARALAFSSSPPTYVVVPGGSTGPGSLNFGTGDFSIDMWIKPSVVVSAPTGILFKYLSGRGYGFTLRNGNFLSFAMADGQYTSLNSIFSVPADGNWHFIAVTVDRDNGSEVVLYIDGQIASGNLTWVQGNLDNNADLLIGTGEPGPARYFDGLMDEIEFFNRALTPGEVQAIRLAGSAGKCKPGACCDGTPKAAHCTDGVYPNDCAGPNQTLVTGGTCSAVPSVCPALTLGACCTLLDGRCQDNLTQPACDDKGATLQPYFSLDNTCVNLDRQCSAELGACCDHDTFGGCADTHFVDCQGGKQEWLKAQSCADVDCLHDGIPTVSEWGLTVLTLLLLIGAKTSFARRQTATAS